MQPRTSRATEGAARRAVALLLLRSLVIVVDETEQVVIVRLGDPVRVVNRYSPNADFGQTGAG
jgi:membrane protease subunit HflC